MAVAIPLITTFAGAVGAGGAAAGFAAIGTLAASGIGGFLTVAGGLLGSMGVLGGDKNLAKFGSILGLAGGLAGGWSSASGGSSEAASGVGDASSAAAAADEASWAAQAAKASEAPLGASLGSSLAGAAPQAAAQNATLGFDYPDAMSQGSLMSRASEGAAPLGQQAAGSLGGAPAVASDAVTQAGQGFTRDSLNGILKASTDKAKTLLGGGSNMVGEFLKNNKEAVSLIGGALERSYGPQSEQLDWQKSLLARRLRNMNSPIRLGPIPGGGG